MASSARHLIAGLFAPATISTCERRPSRASRAFNMMLKQGDVTLGKGM